MGADLVDCEMSVLPPKTKGFKRIKNLRYLQFVKCNRKSNSALEYDEEKRRSFFLFKFVTIGRKVIVRKGEKKRVCKV